MRLAHSGAVGFSWGLSGGSVWAAPRNPCFPSAPSRARTEDPLIKSQRSQDRKPKSQQQLTSSDDAGRSAGRSDAVAGRPDDSSEGGVGRADADPAAVVAA